MYPLTKSSYFLLNRLCAVLIFSELPGLLACAAIRHDFFKDW